MLLNLAVDKLFAAALRTFEDSIAAIFGVVLVKMSIYYHLAAVKRAWNRPKKAFLNVNHRIFVFHFAATFLYVV